MDPVVCAGGHQDAHAIGSASRALLRPKQQRDQFPAVAKVHSNRSCRHLRRQFLDTSDVRRLAQTRLDKALSDRVVEEDAILLSGPNCVQPDRTWPGHLKEQTAHSTAAFDR
jgi:hypothetical protein